MIVEKQAEYDQHTRGKNEFRDSVIGYDSCTTGLNCSILGYMSKGDIVPEVMTTLLNFSKTGLIASEGSRHLERHEADDMMKAKGHT